MSQLISNVIVASVAIAKMREDQREQLLYDLLEKHPSLVIKMMATNGIKFNALEEAIKRIDKSIEKVQNVLEQRYKVVMENIGANKIVVIKKVREMFNFGLADSKNWVEGINCGSHQAGVFGSGVNYIEARKLSDQLLRELGPSGFVCKLLHDDDSYKCPIKETMNAGWGIR